MPRIGLIQIDKDDDNFERPINNKKVQKIEEQIKERQKDVMLPNSSIRSIYDSEQASSQTKLNKLFF
jgi:hypothetical protein